MRRFYSTDSASVPIIIPIVDQPPPNADETDNAARNHPPSNRIADQIHRDPECVVADPHLTVIRSPSGRKLAKIADKIDKTPFKTPRTGTTATLAELDANRLAKSRKISAPPNLSTTQIVKSASRKHIRSHSNLNFNTLLRHKLTNRVLASVDFDSVRRMSVSGENFLAGLVRSKESPAKDEATASETSSSGDDDVGPDDDNGDGAPAKHKKSTSFGARVAAHFAEGALNRHKLAKLKKQRKKSRTNGLYTQNTFGNYAESKEVCVCGFASELLYILLIFSYMSNVNT